MSFKQHSRSGYQSEVYIKCFYGLLLYLMINSLLTMFPVALKAGTLPVRGVLEFVRFTSPLALYCLAATATLFCVLSFCFFSLKSRVVRVLFFIPYLLLLIVSNTLESISYSTYANLVFLFAMCLIPRIPSKTKRAEHWQWGLEWKIGQVIFLVYYGLTGFWKLYFLILNFDFFDLNILNRMIAGYLIKWGKDMALGSWLLDWPVISCLGFYAILALQLGSFWVLMQNQKIVRLWGFLYLLFIVSSYFAMDIIFTGLLPGIFFFLILPGWETQFSSRRQIARIFGVR